MEDRIRTICSAGNICPEFAATLPFIANYKTILLVDDSYSCASKWQYMKNLILMMVSLTRMLCPEEGLDLYFYNRNPCRNVTDHSDVEDAMTEPPTEYRRTVDALRPVLTLGDFSADTHIIILTDGRNYKMNGLYDFLASTSTSATISVANLSSRSNEYQNQMDFNLPNRITLQPCFEDTQASGIVDSIGDYAVVLLTIPYTKQDADGSACYPACIPSVCTIL